MTGFRIFNGSAESSSINSYNNDCSLKLIKDSNYLDVRIDDTNNTYGLTAPLGTILRFNCKIYCSNNQITIQCANQGNEGNVRLVGGVIGEWTDITITFIVTSGLFTIAFQSPNNITNTIYVDDLSLRIV
ncbi:MAG: hypothetical protein IJF83_06110 [Methanobrevibacter sp.]|nr:hypothetical protein [Methanobrevibacter sp.]